MAGPIVQALIALAIAFSASFLGYAIPAALFAAVMIFTHTFAFGVLSKLDPTSRALAGTPAMLMIGAAIGPILGGTLVQAFGYPARSASQRSSSPPSPSRCSRRSTHRMIRSLKGAALPEWCAHDRRRSAFADPPHRHWPRRGRPGDHRLRWAVADRR